MTKFEKWVKDTDISIQLQVAFICKHYDGNCASCFLNHICTNDKKVYEYLNADSESEDKEND